MTPTAPLVKLARASAPAGELLLRRISVDLPEGNLAMRLIRPVAALWLVVLAAGGCDSVKEIDRTLDGKAEATQWFWARLQGIQWRGNQEISSVTRANVATAKAFDVDGVGRGFATLSQRHAQLATQLMALDASDVDQTAIDYCERLVAAHNALSQEYNAHASATESRDAEELSQGRSKMNALLTEYAQLCNEKDSIMAVLKGRYHRDFDVAE